MIFLLCIVFYLIGQSIYTGYYLSKSARLIKQPYTGTWELGDKKNPPLTVSIRGDSVGAGVGASSFSTSVAGRIGHALAEKRYVSLSNESVSGYKVKDVLFQSLPQKVPDITILIVSSNDVFRLTPQKEFEEQVTTLLEKYAAHSKKVLIVGPGRLDDAAALPWFVRLFYKQKVGEYSKRIETVAKKFPNVVHVAPLSIEESSKQYGYILAADKFHPNDSGHTFWFDTIQPAL